MAKAEHIPGKANPRFVVTNVPRKRFGAQALYEDLYCERGEMENRIKEQQLYLFADRTSSATMRANQLRLYFSSFAYVLMQGLRWMGLHGTELEKAQCHSIRLKLFKIGARISVSTRKVGYHSPRVILIRRSTQTFCVTCRAIPTGNPVNQHRFEFAALPDRS